MTDCSKHAAEVQKAADEYDKYARQANKLTHEEKNAVTPDQKKAHKEKLADVVAKMNAADRKEKDAKRKEADCMRGRQISGESMCDVQ